MRKLDAIAALAMLAPLMLAAPSSVAPANRTALIEWQDGPTSATIGSQARITVPAGYRYSGAAGAKKFLELTQNIPSGTELGVLVPRDYRWFVIFRFEDVGYVKDDEKESLDADAMLTSIKENTERANEMRKQRGWTTMTILGWIQQPRYDEATHNLEWSMRAQDSEGRTAANYNTRYLGRRGVMSVKVVCDVRQLDQVLVGFHQVMGGFRYTPENDYHAFVRGDKVAGYGLRALVVGGAAAAASKAGLFKILWKLMLAGWKLMVAAIAGLSAWLKRLFGRSQKTPEAAQSQI